MITENSIIQTSEALSKAELDGEVVVLHIDTGEYYGLNNVGSRILEIAEQNTSVAVIVDTILEQFDVDRERLKKDVLVFLTELRVRNLIITEDGS